MKAVQWHRGQYVYMYAPDGRRRAVRNGPKPKCRDVRDLVAIGWEADMKRTLPEDRV
jgi:hypothetical protein